MDKETIKRLILQRIDEDPEYAADVREALSIREPDALSPETIFIAYNRKDWDDFVEPLVTDLRNRGFQVWIDQLSIRRGSNWGDAIQEALDTCQRMIVCVTPDSMSSDQVKDEYRYFRDANKMVLPLMCREAKMPHDLARIQSISYRDRSTLVDELSA